MDYTKGPWKIEHKPNMGRHFVHGPDNNAVCKMADSRTSEETKANAHLIASAPELLEACKRVLQAISGARNGARPAIDECRNLEQAIAKAEGK